MTLGSTIFGNFSIKCLFCVKPRAPCREVRFLPLRVCGLSPTTFDCALVTRVNLSAIYGSGAKEALQSALARQVSSDDSTRQEGSGLAVVGFQDMMQRGTSCRRSRKAWCADGVTELCRPSLSARGLNASRGAPRPFYFAAFQFLRKRVLI